MSMVINPFASFGVGACDPFFENTVLLCFCDEANGATITANVAFTKPNATISRNGSATIQAASAKFGAGGIQYVSGAGFVDNSSSSIWAMGTGAFTIEFWLNPSSVSVAATFLDMRPNSTNGNFALIYGTSNGDIRYHANSVDRITSSASALTAGAYQFVAYSKQAGSGGTGELSVGGTVVGSWPDTLTYANASCWIGQNAFGSGTQSGSIDMVRITKGVARYSGNFTPPTAPFETTQCTTDPYFSNLVFLWNGGGSNGGTTITNIGPAGPATLTANGTAALSNAQTKFTAPVSALINVNTERWQNASANASLAFGTGAFTLEYWVRYTSLTSNSTFDFRNASNGPYPLIFTNSNGSLAYIENNTTRFTTATSLIAANTWYFVSYSKPTGTSTGQLAIDGTVGGSWSDNSDYNTSTFLTLGGGILASNSSLCYFGPIRVTKGVARYSGNYTPPTGLFPTS